jgi:hypothetical protein
MPAKPKTNLVPGKYYHLFNRGINRRVLFQDEAEGPLRCYVNFHPGLVSNLCLITFTPASVFSTPA